MDLKILKEAYNKKLEIFDDSNFKFNEAKHLYTYNKENFESVTTFIKNFYEPFNSEYWSKRKAQERGITQDAILKEWQNKADVACDMGTEVHLYIEHYFNEPSEDISHRFYNEETLKRIDKFNELLKPRFEGLIPLKQELRIFSKKYKLAGTIDALFLYNGKLMIVDWKTNGKLRTDKDRNFSKMKFPFESEWENEMNKYSIQTSIYSLILEEYGIDVPSAAIAYIPPSEQEPRIYQCKNYKPQLRKYFKQKYRRQDIINSILE